ncbi:MAG: pectinesterase [Alphaproteobacteria bacterium]|nr:pectinesterase [Alphaproteobacteria bacterium]
MTPRCYPFLAALALGCAPPDDDITDDGPILPDIAEGWTQIDPGGETICARGTEYSFFVRKGSVNKVVVDFFGGGACWDDATCGYAGALFADDMDWMRDLMDAPTQPGLYDHANPDNPYADWYHVIVPYCTGDIHWGDSVKTYGEGEEAVTIHHKGAVNTRAVLDWVFEGFSAPEEVFVTGCSAGAYGSIMWSPYFQREYPDARVAQMGDSGAGVVTEGWFAASFPSWNPDSAFPSWIPDLDPATNSYEDMVLPDLYSRIGAFYPEMQLSQFNTLLDWNQTLYFEAMGGEDAWAWSERMRAHVGGIADTIPNFSYYMADADYHCAIVDNRLYDEATNGVKLVDWMAALSSETPPEDVACERCEIP